MEKKDYSKSKYAGPLSKKIKFTKAEDLKLIELIETYSTKSWKKIAENLPPRTARQCRDRWCNYLDPELSPEPWSPSEDKILLKLQEEVGNHWKKIKEYLPRRSKNSIKQRWIFLRSALELDKKPTQVNTNPVTKPPPVDTNPVSNIPMVNTSPAIILTPSNLYMNSLNLSQISNQELIIPVIQPAAILPLTPVYVAINPPTINPPVISPNCGYQGNFENIQNNNNNQKSNDFQPVYQNDLFTILNDNFY